MWRCGYDVFFLFSIYGNVVSSLFFSCGDVNYSLLKSSCHRCFP